MLTSALLRFFFEHCENVYIDPNWWKEAPVETRDAFCQRMAASANPFTARPEAILIDDGINVPPWKVVRRQRVGL